MRWVLAAVSVGLAAIPLIPQAQIIQNTVGSPFSMFAGQNFSAWLQQGNANWQIIDQQAVMNQGAGWLIGKLPLANFEVDMEYWSGKQTQASLYIRCTNTGFINSDTAYQINLTNSQTPASERWNSLRVSANNAYLNVWLNGKKLVDNLYDTRFASGPLALNVFGGEFRIRKLNVTIPGRW